MQGGYSRGVVGRCCSFYLIGGAHTISLDPFCLLAGEP